MLIKYEFQRICCYLSISDDRHRAVKSHHPSYTLILAIAWNPSYAVLAARHHSPTPARVYIQQDTMIQYNVRRLGHHRLPIQPISVSAPATCLREPLSTPCKTPQSRIGHP